MYLGELVEVGKTDELYHNPLHPYTRALLSAISTFDQESRNKRIYLSGELPSPVNPPSGCRLHPRCPISIDGLCNQVVPKTLEVGNEYTVRCHAVEKQLKSGDASDRW